MRAEFFLSTHMALQKLLDEDCACGRRREVAWRMRLTRHGERAVSSPKVLHCERNVPPWACWPVLRKRQKKKCR